MKNIYITDLDHTFLRNDLSVSDYTKNTWNSYSEDSILSIATARTYMKTAQFLGGVDINAPMILLDGALIATMDKKIIDTKFMGKDISDMIIDEGWKFGIYPFILSLANSKNLTEAFLHDEVLNKHQREVLNRYSSADNLQKHSGIRAMEENFKIVYMGEEDLLRELAEHLENIFGNDLKYILAPEAYVGCYFLTILHPEADKSHGIQTISEYIGFDLEKLTVFGDNFNDIGMFNLAGTSVAMANAQPEVKDKADIVLSHNNDEDGVAKYLQGLKGA
ncbi:MAG: Cof subfamily protein (haloacid dehalogenase superfamily) [Sulfurimonas sp.]|jgi:Cof subfamily protein (haloacid dehalogenase superfamily)|uniref:HAD-IIB family hydrolase n=1 Tax=Sulfurimonas sp. TaxID=2022749 RepID=UPI0039E23EA1